MAPWRAPWNTAGGRPRPFGDERSPTVRACVGEVLERRLPRPRAGRTLGPRETSVRRLPLLLLLTLPIAALNLCMFSEALQGALPARAPAAAGDLERLPRMVVIVLDGVDFHLAQAYMDAGKLPNLAALAKGGTYQPLLSEIPPESPVALASMLTGVGPGRHHIFDFVLRGAGNVPENGMTRIKRARFIGRVPVRQPLVSSRLAFPTFSERVWEAGYSVLALRQPLLFPVKERPGARMTSGLGTPDLAGSAGFYTIYSNRLIFKPGYTIFGGLRVPLEGDGNSQIYDTYILGTQDPSLGPAANGGNQRTRLPLRFERATENGKAGVRITLQGQTQFVAEGERSDFFSMTFLLNTIPARTVPSVVRMEVRSVEPLEVLADPAQIDPRDAYFPISAPESLGAELWRLDGPFETMGWQEQTFALNDRFQSDAGFLRDMLQDLDRGAVTLLREMRRVREGHTKTPRLVFYTFTATDRACHCFWRYRDPGHPAHASATELAGTDPILTVFEKADAIVGRVRAELEAGDTLIVASDHGFQTWRWGVHVNQWLVDHGYMTLKKDAERKGLGPFFMFADADDAVDWSKTKAFALGLGQIYINLAGRDETGIVPLAEKRALMLELKTKLEALTNPYLTGNEADGVGAKAIRSVKILEDVYRFGPGGAPDHVPDLQLGFEKGYRISWQTALLGGMGRSGHVFERNTVPWSGDHCSTDRELVPGVLFSNRKIAPAGAEPYTVRDIAATVMRHFGIDLAPLEGESQPLPFEDE